MSISGHDCDSGRARARDLAAVGLRAGIAGLEAGTELGQMPANVKFDELRAAAPAAAGERHRPGACDATHDQINPALDRKGTP